jgi:hypothetical protein
MTTNTCRNCGSHEKYSKELPVGATSCRVLLPIGPRMIGKAESMAAFEIQICGVCGATEWFVPRRLLPEVKAKFSRLPES